MPFHENAPDKRVHFLRLLRRRGASGPDGPDGFVSNDDTVEVRGCQPVESANDLLADDAFGVTQIALLQGFSDAHDDRQSRRQSRVSLATDHFVCLGKVLAPFRVSDDYVRASRIPQHESCDLAGKRAFLLFSRAVLGGNLDIRSFQTISDALQSRKHRSDDDITVVRVSDERLQSDRHGDRVTHGLEHFPVSGDYRFTHDNLNGGRRQSEAATALWFKIQQSENGVALRLPPHSKFHHSSVSAATPGSSFPARNSSVAPPPVEMCVMRPATPAWVTAATESPPPTITVAPRSAASATACAMPIVP